MPIDRGDRRRPTDQDLDAAAEVSQSDLDNAVVAWDDVDDGFGGLLDTEPTDETDAPK